MTRALVFAAMATSLPLLCASASALEPGSGSQDRVDRTETRAPRDNTERDIARDAERAARDSERRAQDAEQARIRAEEDLARVEFDRARDLARAEADIAEQLARAAEDAAEEAARAARDAARAAEDAAEDAERDAEDAAEDAARAAQDQGAALLQQLVAGEATELDADGFPVRQGEIIALDISSRSLSDIRSRGFRIIERVDLGRGAGQLTRIAVPPGQSTAMALAALRRDHPAIVFDYAHYFGSPFATAGRPIGQRMEQSQPRRPEAATVPFSVGMIDTGVSLPTTVSATRVITRNFGGANSPGDHGTAVASILARNGAERIMAANVFRGNGVVGHADANGIARALGWLIEERVPVINLSFAGPRNAVVDALLGQAIGQGQLVIAAVGNAGPTAPPAYPAATPGVIAVTATDAQNAVYRYAIHGQHVYFAARGVDVTGYRPDGRTALYSGTSFAAPFVAAVLSQCIQRVGRGGPAVCVEALERRARDLGTPGRDDVYGFGLVG